LQGIKVVVNMENSNWFTVEMIDETTYAISEYKHREELL